MSNTGLYGFDGGAEFDFAAGSVRGVRWWRLRMPAGERRQLALEGVNAGVPWAPGENRAVCRRIRVPHPAAPGHGLVPLEDCGCGFWAYWAVPDTPNPHKFGLPVLGVVEGYGRTLIGDKGFRCARARILGLHFPEGATGLVEDLRAVAEPRCLRTPGAVETWRALTGQPGKRFLPPGEDEAIARLAEVELDLGDRYGVPVYAGAKLLLAMHPPTRDYLPSAAG